MERLSLKLKPELVDNLPIKAVQFGEGNFIRGFIDWMLYKLNQAGFFNGKVVAIQPTPHGRVAPVLKEQDCLFTTIFHGVVDGKEQEQVDLVNSVKDVINPYEHWSEVLALAHEPNLQFVFSNTTEAGITYEQTAYDPKVAPLSYPAKLTAFLYERFKYFTEHKLPNTPLTILPCELIEDNASQLQKIILKHIQDWNLGTEFTNFVTHECSFVNTLVDRVVSGFPKEPQPYYAKLGYEDRLIACGEIFHFLALEGDQHLEELLPLAKIGLNVVVAKDISPYRLRKVRILNGTHTANVPAAFLAGLDTVDQMMADPVVGKFARSVLFEEIIPSIELEQSMLDSFAKDTVARFSDPQMHHRLISIMMNCASKMKARVLPSLLDSRKHGVLPHKLCFSFAAFIALYKEAHDGKVYLKHNQELCEFSDDPKAIDLLAQAWAKYDGTESSMQNMVKEIMADLYLWGQDLSLDQEVCALISKQLYAIDQQGIVKTMQEQL